MLDYIFSVLILFSGFIFIRYNKKKFNVSNYRTLNKLWIYHIIFILLFYIYTQNNSADANGYWRIAKNSSETLFYKFLSMGPGTNFIYVINYFPAKILDLSIFTGMLFYGLLGFLGFYFFYYITIQLIPHNYKLNKINLFPALFFLPNLHFWTAGVGKDSLMFFCIGLFSFSMLKISKRMHLIFLSLFLIYMVRPHVLIMLLFAFSLAFLFSKKISKPKKIFFSSLLIGVVIVITPLVLKYLNLDYVSTISDVIVRTETQASNLSGKSIGSSIDISSYPYPLKVFSFLFRPLFFYLDGLFSLVSSFENLLLLILTIKIVNKGIIKSIRKSPLVIKGLAFFLISGTLIFSLSLSNLGIILRMKNMFLPGFLILILWSLSYQRTIKSNKTNK